MNGQQFVVKLVAEDPLAVHLGSSATRARLPRLSPPSATIRFPLVNGGGHRDAERDDPPLACPATHLLRVPARLPASGVVRGRIMRT
jgi:hypothetical protein